jgi:hypothetical protein
LGLRRNKVAVPEGVAGTPPFWSAAPTSETPAVRSSRRRIQGQQQSPVRLYLSFGLFYSIRQSAAATADKLKIIDNTERENEVRKIEIR